MCWFTRTKDSAYLAHHVTPRESAVPQAECAYPSSWASWFPTGAGIYNSGAPSYVVLAAPWPRQCTVSDQSFHSKPKRLLIGLCTFRCSWGILHHCPGTTPESVHGPLNAVRAVLVPTPPPKVCCGPGAPVLPLWCCAGAVPRLARPVAANPLPCLHLVVGVGGCWEHRASGGKLEDK